MQQDAVLVAVICTFILSAALLFLMFIFKFEKTLRRIICAVSLLCNAFAMGALAVGYTNLLAILFLFISIYQIINILRIVQSRMNEEYLFRSTKRTFYYLFISQLLILGIFGSKHFFNWQIKNDLLLQGLVGVTLLVSIILAVTTLLNIFLSKTKPTGLLADSKLPTLTLAIPARNENEMLTDCLEAATGCTYPKLEILVLDDCSQDKTAQIIKSYAQKGVRFVQAGIEDDSWLSKNQAYQVLLDQSAGDLIMFMGVDVDLSPDSLTRIVEVFLADGVNMMSVMPKRVKSGLIAAFIQPMRYWWELSIPRWFLKRPPVLSTCWLMDKQVLVKMGGFKSVKRAIIPEEHLAWQQSKLGMYRFIRNTKYIDLTTQKDFFSQWSTALRTRYPQVHRRPELVVLRSLIMTVFLLLPFVICVLQVTTSKLDFYVFIISLASVILLVTSNVLISSVTNPMSSMLAVINFPINVVLDLIALHISMIRYEFGEVIWKGRNVSDAAMHVYYKLPKI